MVLCPLVEVIFKQQFLNVCNYSESEDVDILLVNLLSVRYFPLMQCNSMDHTYAILSQRLDFDS